MKIHIVKHTLNRIVRNSQAEGMFMSKCLQTDFDFERLSHFYCVLFSSYTFSLPEVLLHLADDVFSNLIIHLLIVGLFDLQKLLNLVIKLLFVVLHGFSIMTSSIKIPLFDLPGFNFGFKIVLTLLKLPPEVVFRFGF